jgi:uncharacterized protein YdeI (YjbR/CyaY-like superfamily)
LVVGTFPAKAGIQYSELALIIYLKYIIEKMNQKIEDFFSSATQWQKEMELLRSLALACGLNEEFKWMHPCYTFKENNVIIIHGFKEYCAINFFKGALLQDADKLLVQQTENVQSARQLRFTNTEEIIKLEATIKAYIFEALEVEKAGLKVELKKHDDYIVPEELQHKIDNNPTFKTAYEALTPGRQRGYILHITAAKQAQTRTDRVEKCTPRILKGKGLTDCICGKSKRMPNCDGSHKYL